MKHAAGKVYLVGGGPGDPGLLTLRGAECLAAADVVLYDYLATPELLGHTRHDAELVCLGRHGHGRLLSQQEVCQRMVDAAAAGKTVVRLKGGDPAIFARLSEELLALEAAHIDYEIVPGITAAQAAGSYAGISLTDRDAASCVAFVTGQERAGKDTGEGLDYAALARFPGTLVFYMGVTTAPEWSRALVAHGKPAETPVVIVRRCSLPNQQTIAGTLGEVGQLLAPGKLRPPVIVIVGDVARAPQLARWFTSRPLFGQTVLVTRPAHQAAPLGDQLMALGAQVLCQAAIEIGPPPSWDEVDAALDQLAEFDWLVFSSSNGVEYFFHRLKSKGHDLRALGGVKLAAIGPATVAALARYHLAADAEPETYRAEALAEVLCREAAGKRFLLARASRGREVLRDMLTDAGGVVTQIVVYESRDVRAPADDIAAAMAAGTIDWTTVTSSAIARSLVAMFGDTLKETRLAAISPLTADVLAELGYPPAVVADEYTTQGLVAALRQASSRS